MEEVVLAHRRRTLLRVTRAALCLSLAGAVGCEGGPARGSSGLSDGATPAARGVPAPAVLALADADLEAVQRAVRARRGAPLLLNFWAAWCDPCVEELPDLAAAEGRFRQSGLRVLGISADLFLEDDSPSLRERVTALLKRSGVAYPNLLYIGPPDPLIESFDLPGPIPHSILYDAEGNVARRWTGRISLSELKKAVRKMRAHSPSSGGQGG